MRCARADGEIGKKSAIKNEIKAKIQCCAVVVVAVIFHNYYFSFYSAVVAAVFVFLCEKVQKSIKAWKVY